MRRILMVVVVIVLLLLEAAVSYCRAAATTLTLAWDPSPDTAMVAGYRIFQTSSATTNVAMIDAGLATTRVVPVSDGASHTFYVVAVSTNGITSDPSNVVTYGVPAGPPPPPTVFNTDAVVVDGQWKLTLWWNPVASNHGVTNYLMIVRQGTLLRTNQVGLSLTASMTVPPFNTTESFIQSQSDTGFSVLFQAQNVRKPGASANLKVTRP